MSLVYSGWVDVESDGVLIRGLVSIHEYHYWVRISRPFHFLSSGSRIPVLHRAYRKYDLESGMSRGVDELVWLYRLGCYIQSHMDDLQGAYVGYNQRQYRVFKSMCRFEFPKKRTALRSRLRSGEITNVEYQQLFTLLRKEKESFFCQMTELTDKFFDENFNFYVPCGTREEVLQILGYPDLLIHGTRKDEV